MQEICHIYWQLPPSWDHPKVRDLQVLPTDDKVTPEGCTLLLHEVKEQNVSRLFHIMSEMLWTSGQEIKV